MPANFGLSWLARQQLQPVLQIGMAMLAAVDPDGPYGSGDEDLELIAAAALAELPATPERPLIAPRPIDIGGYGAPLFKGTFRFWKPGFWKILPFLGWPATIVTRSRKRWDSAQLLLLVLYRLAYPCTWWGLAPIFGRYPEAMSGRGFNWATHSVSHYPG